MKTLFKSNKLYLNHANIFLSQNIHRLCQTRERLKRPLVTLRMRSGQSHIEEPSKSTRSVHRSNKYSLLLLCAYGRLSQFINFLETYGFSWKM